MKSIPTTVASLATWWVVILSSAVTNRYWCVLGGSSNGLGPWGAKSSGYHRKNRPGRPQNPSGLLPFRESAVPHSPRGLAHPQQLPQKVAMLSRGGYKNSGEFASPPPSLVRIVGTIVQLGISAGKTVLPPLVGTIKGIVRFYGALPMDAIKLQIGLVYCFLGGYYPTLFSSLQAARHCGWNTMCRAINDLTDEAVQVIDEMEDAGVWDPVYDDDASNPRLRKDLFLKQTYIVLTTVDPAKINTAAGALYTSWLGISAILQREYARVINLSLTLAEGFEVLASILLLPALNLVTPRDFRRWIPVLLGWASKAYAMRIAWRIERVLTAATAAIAGGAMVARAVTRMIWRKQRPQPTAANPPRSSSRKRSSKRSMVVSSNDNEEEDEDEDTEELTAAEHVLGFAVGGLGFYSQMETQYKRNFSFVVPFPLSLVTWPFDLAERWIQWYITDYS